MNILLSGGAVWMDGSFHAVDVAICDGHITSIGQSLPREGFLVIDLYGSPLVPGFVDVHVHLREPGLSYKETIAAGTAAGSAGGYTALGAMPNLKPIPDSLESLQVQLDLIAKDACIHVHPYGAITQGERGDKLADMEAMAPYVLGFSDDGRGVQNDAMMRQAMVEAKRLGKPIVAHCEDESLLKGCITVHPGKFAQDHGYKGACAESEWGQIARDLKLVEEIGCQYHVCHISTKESVELIRQAKAKGLAVSCETGPHYLVLCDEEMEDQGRFKMNPPIRGKEDREALILGLVDGTIDCLATDHAPHSAQEKAGNFTNSANGIVGLEPAFAVVYTQLVESGLVPLETVLNALTVNPCKLFNLPGGTIAVGAPADLTVLDLNRPHVIDATTFKSLGHSTPFDGWSVSADIALTICKGEVVYDNPKEA